MPNNDKNTILIRLAGITITTLNWAALFSSELRHDPTIGKAFTIWFPALLEFLKGKNELTNICLEEKYTEIIYGDKNFRNFIEDLITKAEAVASLLSFDEQVFIIDRRMQNVHGFLARYSREKIGFDFYDKQKGTIEKIQLSIKEHSRTVGKFYSQKEGFNFSEIQIRNKVIESKEWKDFGTLMMNYLKIEDLSHIEKILQ